MTTERQARTGARTGARTRGGMRTRGKVDAELKAAVLGSDVSKSRSPPIHLAAWKAIGRGGRYDAISIPARAFRSTVRDLAAAGYDYVNVTIPHKRLAAGMATSRSPAVAMTGAANTLVFSGGAHRLPGRKNPKRRPRIHGDNTDGEGLLAALADLGVTVGGRTRVVMIGAGGAAAGALLALCLRGAQVVVLARRPAAASGLVRRLPARLRSQARAGGWTDGALAGALAGADILVSAVPAAAWEPAEARADLAALSAKTAVLEMAYGKSTPLARAVRKKTRRYQDGLPMLVHQAAAAVQVALGKTPPVGPMFRAARRAA